MALLALLLSVSLGPAAPPAAIAGPSAPALSSSLPPSFSAASSTADPNIPGKYFGARYYGSRIGRFTTTDPVYNWKENLVDPQRWNRYAYGRNNPLRYVDPDGKDVFTQQEVFQAWGEYQRGEITLQQYQAHMNAIGKSGLIAAGIYAGVAAAAFAPELLAAAAVKAADPRTQPFGTELLEGMSGAPPGSSGTLPYSQKLLPHVRTVQNVLKGSVARSELSTELLEEAAQHYERAAQTTGGAFKGIAREYNLARAKYLREGGAPPGRTIYEFAESRGLKLPDRSQ